MIQYQLEDHEKYTITPMTETTSYAAIFNGHDLMRWNKIKKVIYNNPATIVLWEDGTKTVVKCMENEEYNPEFGLLYCIAKQFMGTSFLTQMRDHCWNREEVITYYNREHDLSEFHKLLP